MGLDFNRNTDPRKQYKRILSTSNVGSVNEAANQLTHENIAFLESLGFEVKNNGKIRNIRRIAL